MRQLFRFSLVLATLLTLASVSKAGVVLVTSPGGLTADATVDWSLLGPSFMLVASGFTTSVVTGTDAGQAFVSAPE